MMKTDDIRNKFLEFFRSKSHEIVPGDSLVPKDDPTLLFTGAGMNQFKEKFLSRNITYKRASSCQKCLRTGDLENVGKTSGHHTFFEMLGNFSFGDYFKKDAISLAWEFLTKVLKIDSERLWASVYKDDEEAHDIWRDVIKIPEKRIIKFGEKENFWPSETPTKGPNGPCGPCSEIFYDYGKDVGCRMDACTPACDCGRFVEVWNLVFTQFDRQTDGKLMPLPNKNIDTGMGLERLASVMQGVKTNFETDIFVPIVEAIVKEVEQQGGKIYPAKKNAIADHIRAVTFVIADGVMPSNEERGYVVRKLIRRAMLHGSDIGVKRPFLYKLVSVVADVMERPYPELKLKREDIAQIVKKEEESFLNVIITQLPRVEDAFAAIAGAGKEKIKELPKIAFNFYDTYGMPYEMLEEMAEKFKLKIDKKIFDDLLDKQRQQSRSKTKIKGEIFSETFAKKVMALGLKTEFLGYEKSHGEAKVLAVMENGEVILDKTPFYGESGGQVGDWGKIETKSGAMEVEDAKRIGDTIVHIGKVLRGNISKGEIAKVSIDEETRKAVMANHTATHLMQAALRKVLGEHVRQTGSLVDESHLRFDFTHMKKLEPREVVRVEGLVNEWIKKSMPVKKEIKSLEDAKKSGAIAIFDEKYDKSVRVVSVGEVSKELCGGTHVDNTKDIRIFKITSESGIASGVRRIEAMTGDAAKHWLAEQKEAESRKLKAESEKELEKKSMEARLAKEIANIDSLITKARSFGSSKVVSADIDGLNIENLRILSDRIRQKESSAVIILSTKSEGKASFIISVTEDLVKKDIKAGDLAKHLAGLLDGSGGGKPNFAQGGGRSPAKLEDALKNIQKIVKERLI